MILKCRSDSEFEINEIINWSNIHINDEWDDYNGEGTSNYSCTPQYLITIPTLTSLYIYINTNKDLASQLSLLKSDKRINDFNNDLVLSENEAYHYEYNQLNITELSIGKYILCPTGYRGSKGEYSLCIQSPTKIQIERCKYYDECFNHYKYDGKWRKSDKTAAGCSNYGKYENNPKIQLTIPKYKDKYVKIILAISCSIYKDTGYKCAIYKRLNSISDINHNIKNSEPLIESNHIYNKSRKYLYSEICDIESGCDYITVPSTLDPIEGDYTIHIFSSIILNNNNNLKLISKTPKFIQKCCKIDDSLILQQSLLSNPQNSKIVKIDNKNFDNIRRISLGIKDYDEMDEERKSKDEEIKLLKQHIRCLLSEREELKNEMMQNALDNSVFRRKSSIQTQSMVANSISLPMKAFKEQQTRLKDENDRLRAEINQLQREKESSNNNLNNSNSSNIRQGLRLSLSSSVHPSSPITIENQSETKIPSWYEYIINDEWNENNNGKYILLLLYIIL